MSAARLLPAPVRRYARRSVRLFRRTYRTVSNIPRYRDLDMDCGVTVNVDMWHRNWYQVFQKGYHEQDVEKFITGLLQPGDVVFDVGAQIGMFTAIASQLIGPDGRLIAFEPDEKNHRDLQSTRQRNKLDNVSIINAGLSDSIGEATFHRPDGAWGSFMDSGNGAGARITRDFFQNTTIRTFTIQTTTIDHVVAERELERLDLIKIDVDGPEVTILRGAEQTLRTLKPVVMVEASRFYQEHGTSVDELFSILQRNGYEIYGTIRNGESARLMTSPADIDNDLSAVGSAMNFFCVVPGTYDSRWKDLWFMQEG